MKVRILQYPKDLAKSISNQVITSSHINPEALGMIVKVVRTFRTGTSMLPPGRTALRSNSREPSVNRNHFLWKKYPTRDLDTGYSWKIL